MTIEELENKIKEYSKAYHDGKEIISDSEYDALCVELKKLDPQNQLVESDMEEGENFNGFKKEKHFLITGTLRKCRNAEEAKAFISKHPNYYSVQMKLDGAGIELIIKDGKIVDAITRGNGFEGFSILNNFLKIKSRKDSSLIKYNGLLFTGSIRGEYFMTEENFKRYFPDMKNPRNACAGIIKRLDGEDCEKLSFMAYDALDESHSFEKETDKLSFLSSNGFEIPENTMLIYAQDILKYREKIAEVRNTLGYPIDGIVCKVLKTDYSDLERRTPLNNFAIKFDLDTAVSKILDIEWNLKGTILSPVAILEPVELNGTTVSRATLSNTSIMEKMGVEIGKEVIVVKRGEIIPHIEEVL